MSLLTEMINFKKGDKNTYFPKAGETCLFSGPNCDDEDGFVYISVEVLWTDEIFIITRVPGCWPNVDKWEHIRCKPLEAIVEMGRRRGVTKSNHFAKEYKEDSGQQYSEAQDLKNEFFFK